MLWHVWQRAVRADVDVVIAACDDEVAQVARDFGAEVVLTDPSLECGSDRVAEVVRDRPVDHIVNLQADEPLVEPETLCRLFQELELPEVHVCTPVAPMQVDPGPSAVKVVVDARDDALYFSRAPIPHGGPFLRHLGLYGYKREALFDFVGLGPGTLERVEGLEQLRLLEHGFGIRVVRVSQAPPSVDTEQDLGVVRELLEGP